MEPARSTGNFNRRITVADSNNIITVLDMNAANAKYQIFDQDYLVEFQAVLEDLKVTVGLLSLLEAPWPDTNALMSESATMAEIAKIRTQGQKISLGLYVASGNGPWQYESEVILQNQGGSETHVPILMPFLSSNETLLIAGNFKLGVKIEPKWNQPLKLNDYLVIKGTWRQIVSFSKKKDDDVDALAARIAALELALEGRLINLPANTLLGRNATAGTVQAIAQSTFKAADAELLDGIDSTRICFGDNFSKSMGTSVKTVEEVFTSSGFFDCAIGNLPSDFNLMQGFQARHGAAQSLWGMQAGCQHNRTTSFYFRTVSNGVWSPWRNIWNDGNFNPNSHTQTFNNPSARGIAISSTSMPITGAATITPGFEIQSTAGAGAYFAFHRPGLTGAYFGMDADNILKYGGWSQPGLYRIWHEQYGTPVWQSPSDIRLKKNIQSIESALQMINKCKPIRFKYNSEIRKSELYGSKKEREKYHYGFIAQDFELGDLVYEKENGYLGIDYIEIIPFLVRAIQELSEQIT